MSANKMVTKSDLKDFYDGIYPYLNGSVPVIANKFDKADMYSENEQIVGRWIDGKPVYAKTFTGSITSGSQDLFVMPDVLNDIIEVRGYAYGSENYRFPFNYTQGSTTQCVIFLKPDGKTISYRGVGVTSGSYVLVLKYTKASDTAISVGYDTDYSTTEKIIGTWIDGKPLYQKVYTQDFSSYSQTVNVETGLTNITMIAMDVRMSYSNGSLYPCVYGNSSNYLACYFASSNGTVVITDKISNVTSGTFFVTLQYTKTTD